MAKDDGKNPGFWKGYAFGFMTWPVLGGVLGLAAAAVGLFAGMAANRRDEIPPPNE